MTPFYSMFDIEQKKKKIQLWTRVTLAFSRVPYVSTVKPLFFVVPNSIDAGLYEREKREKLCGPEKCRFWIKS